MQALSTRTRRFAHALRAACLGGMALGVWAGLPIGYSLESRTLDRATALGFDPTTWQADTWAGPLVLCIGWLGIAALLYTLWHMSRLFAHYSQGTAIAPATADTIRKIGIGFLAQAGAGVLSDPLETLALSLGAPPGQRMVSVGFGTQDMGFFLAGSMLLIIGAVMVQAVDMARENAEFV